MQPTFSRKSGYSAPRLEEGEEPAILIDTYHNRARIYAPFDECQLLASCHQYELFIRRQPEETFTSHIERLLSLKHPKMQKPGFPEDEPGLNAGASNALITTGQLGPEQMPNASHLD